MSMITSKDLRQAGIPKEAHARIRRQFRGFHYQIQRHPVALRGGPLAGVEVWVEEVDSGLLPMAGGRYVRRKDEPRVTPYGFCGGFAGLTWECDRSSAG